MKYRPKEINILRASALAIGVASAVAFLPALLASADDAADFTSDVGQARQEVDQNVNAQAEQTAVVDGEDQTAASVSNDGATNEADVFATPAEADGNNNQNGDNGTSVLDTSETVDVKDADDLSTQSLDVISSQDNEDQTNQAEIDANQGDQGSVDSSGGDQGSVDQSSTDQGTIDQSQPDQSTQDVTPADQGSTPADQQ